MFCLYLTAPVRLLTLSTQIITERLTIDSRTIPAKKSTSSSTKSIQPAYSLFLTYHRSTSGGKSLLARGKTRGSISYTEFFDDKGVMHQEKFEKWMGQLVEDAMEGKSS